MLPKKFITAFEHCSKCSAILDFRALHAWNPFDEPNAGLIFKGLTPVDREGTKFVWFLLAFDLFVVWLFLFSSEKSSSDFRSLINDKILINGNNNNQMKCRFNSASSFSCSEVEVPLCDFKFLTPLIWSLFVVRTTNWAKGRLPEFVGTCWSFKIRLFSLPVIVDYQKRKQIVLILGWHRMHSIFIRAMDVSNGKLFLK